MITNTEMDWSRAFFARFLAFLGTGPLLFACGPLMFLEQRPGGAKEALICTVSLFASLMFVLALYLGRWMIQTAGSDVMRWRMGMLGTTIIWGELFISVNLVFWNAWSALRYFTH